MTSYVNKKKVTHSDHFTLVLNLNISYKRKRPERHEYYNFKDCIAQQAFKDVLNKEDNLVRCFDTSEDFEVQFNNWWKQLNILFFRCFEKVRYTGKIKKTETTELFERRTQIV